MALDGILLRLATAFLLGTIIGAERQWSHHAAGLKTNALVCLGAAIFTLFGAATAGADSVARVGAQVASGIGFLGGGVILREGLTVRGLNTAATLWCSAAVGVFAGAGQIVGATLAALFVLAVNIAMKPVADRISTAASRRHGGAMHYTIIVSGAVGMHAEIRRRLTETITKSPVHPNSLDISSAEHGERVEVKAVLTLASRSEAAIEEIAAAMRRSPAVSSANWHADSVADAGN